MHFAKTARLLEMEKLKKCNTVYLSSPSVGKTNIYIYIYIYKHICLHLHAHHFPIKVCIAFRDVVGKRCLYAYNNCSIAVFFFFFFGNTAEALAIILDSNLF